MRASYAMLEVWGEAEFRDRAPVGSAARPAEADESVFTKYNVYWLKGNILQRILGKLANLVEIN